MARRFVATGPFDVSGGDDKVLHYDEGDEVPEAANFENVDDFVRAGRLVEKVERKPKAKAKAKAEG